jgi:hypothetical protein
MELDSSAKEPPASSSGAQLARATAQRDAIPKLQILVNIWLLLSSTTWDPIPFVGDVAVY